MLPPPEVQDEPNYYNMEKPRKNKKYSAAAEKKPLKKPNSNLKEKIVKIEAQPSNEEVKKSEKPNESEDYEDEALESAPSSRLDFSMNGN